MNNILIVEADPMVAHIIQTYLHRIDNVHVLGCVSKRTCGFNTVRCISAEKKRLRCITAAAGKRVLWQCNYDNSSKLGYRN